MGTNKGLSERETKKNLHSFRGGSSYILIPLLGILLAGLVMFFAKDFFLGTRPPEYHKPEVAKESPEKPVPEGQDTRQEVAGIPLTGDDNAGIEQGLEALPGNAGKDVNLAAPESEADHGAKSIPEQAGKDMSGEVGNMDDEHQGEVAETVKPRVNSPSAVGTDNMKYQDDGTWGIQIGMFGRKSDAERLLKEVREKGYNPDITRPGNYYRVRVNGGASVETALMLKKMLHDEGYDTLVVRSENAPDGSGSVEGFSKYQQDDSWGVQIGMFGSRSDAQRLVSEVENKGFHADITRPGNYYRVRVRAGSDEGTASRIQSLLAQEGYETLIVRSAP